MNKLLLTLLLGLLVTACSDNTPETTAVEPAPEQVAEPTPPKQGTVFDDQLKTLDKAKSVEDTLAEAAAAERKKIEESTQ